MDTEKIANNILDFLLDPTKIPPTVRIYQRPGEVLDNRVYEESKADSNAAYHEQHWNSDFYPLRNRSMAESQNRIKEGSQMDRRTLVASLDILSQQFKEDTYQAQQLRTMAYAAAKMSDEDLQAKLAEEAPGFPVEAGGNLKGVCDKCGRPNFICRGTCQDKKQDKKAGDAKGPGIPDKDGKGPKGDTPECPMSKKESDDSEAADWSKEATDLIAQSLVEEFFPETEAKPVEAKKAPAKDETEPPAEGDPQEPEACKKAKSHADSESAAKETKEEGKAMDAPSKAHEESETPAEEVAEEAKAKKAEEETKEAETAVDTEILATDQAIEFEGIELTSSVISSDEVSDMSDQEQAKLAEVLDFGKMSADDQDKYDQLFK